MLLYCIEYNYIRNGPTHKKMNAENSILYFFSEPSNYKAMTFPNSKHYTLSPDNQEGIQIVTPSRSRSVARQNLFRHPLHDDFSLQHES